MTRRRPCLSLPALALAVLCQTSAAAQPELHHQDQPEGSPILAYYDFEEPTPSGPTPTGYARRAAPASTSRRRSGLATSPRSGSCGRRSTAAWSSKSWRRDEG
ncbi:MAG TPA: hypothetical protein VGG06_00510 [Thermoanaerobaculia bacterium]